MSTRYLVMSRITQDNYDKSIPKVKEVWESKGPRSKKNLYYYLEFHQGVKVDESAGELQELAKKFYGDKFKEEIPEGYSTIVIFEPDGTLFESVKSDLPSKNIQYFQLIQEKFNKRKVQVLVNGKEDPERFTPYKYEVLRTVVPSKPDKNPNVRIYVSFEVDQNIGTHDSFGSVNALVVPSGHHVQIAEACYREALVKTFNLSHNYVLNGLRLFVIVLAEELLFDSQTKTRLKSIVGAKSSDFGDVVKDMIKIMKSNIEEWQTHVDRLNAYAESVTQLSAVDKVKQLISKSAKGGGKSRSALPKSVVDASAPESKRGDTELFLTEGRSAAGSMLKSRDSRIHAIMALRGKPLNSTSLDYEAMLNNAEMKAIVQAIGLGLDIYHDISNPRYGKIVISADSDIDGGAIASLLIGMICKHMKFLIDAGMLYVAESPIYLQNGKYFYPSDIDKKGKIPGLNLSKPFQRFKGLDTSPLT